MSDERATYEFKITKFMADIRDACGSTASLRDIAARVGVSAATLSRMDNGALPDMDTFTQVCARLELSPGEYFERVVWVRRGES